MTLKPYIASAGLFAGMLVLVISFNPVPAAGEKDTGQTDIDRGQYLVTVAGCHDCHTPKKFGPDGMSLDYDREFMGHPADEQLPAVPDGVLSMDGWVFMGNSHLSGFAGPWGISYAANLTPDEETGIGSWTEEMFIKAMRTGQHMGEGRPILPPMPWFNLVEAKEEDLKAIYAYLQSLRPIYNPVPEPVPPSR
jgi:hypothetical protein